MNANVGNNISIFRMIILSAVSSAAVTLLLVFCFLPQILQVVSIEKGIGFGLSGSSTSPEPGAAVQTAAVKSENKAAKAIDRAIAQANPTQAVTSLPSENSLAEREDTVELSIPAKQSLDYRLTMERDYHLDYHWTAYGKTVYTELRGESRDGKIPDKTFANLTSKTGKGFFIIPFNGQFGWHWQNKTDQPITIRLHTKGVYKVVGEVR